MGMSGSQARLLSLTARKHDLEYRAQSIQNSKLQLATQQDEAYQEYLKALDETTLTITALDMKTGEKSTLEGTFNNIFSSNRALAANGSDYILKDKYGRVVVEEDVYNGYQLYRGNSVDSAQAFAMYMMDITNDLSQPEEGSGLTWNWDTILKEAELAAYNNNGDPDEELTDLRNKIAVLTGNNDVTDIHGIYDTNAIYQDKDKMKEYDELLEKYLNRLYTKYGKQIYERLNTGSGVDFDKEKFDYYVNLYNSIQMSGGCISINDFNGFNGNASSDSDWLQSMIQSGQMTIHEITREKSTNKQILNGVSVASDSVLNYTEVTKIDKTALAKAEAKYEKHLRDIGNKDKAYDLDLSKIEAQHTAIKTEIDSVEKVIDANIQKSFKIFS